MPIHGTIDHYNVFINIGYFKNFKITNINEYIVMVYCAVNWHYDLYVQ